MFVADVFHKSHDQSALHPSFTYPSHETSNSYPSSIAQFVNQSVSPDLNNNSLMDLNAYLSKPLYKGLNYTLASSMASSDTQSENTSMLQNVGSSNTSGFPNTLIVPPSQEPSGHVTPEDLSNLVNEMSSIRPVEESSVHPNSSMEPSSDHRVTSVSGHSVSTDIHGSYSKARLAERLGSIASVNTSSQVTCFLLL